MEEIKQEIIRASKQEFNGVVAFTEDDVVSSDFIGDSRTSIFDVNAGIMLSPTFVQLVAWYDNEMGYSTKLVDLCAHVMKK